MSFPPLINETSLGQSVVFGNTNIIADVGGIEMSDDSVVMMGSVNLK